MQAGLPLRGDNTAGRAATVAKAARTTTSSKSLTVSAAMRRAIDTLLMPRLKVRRQGSQSRVLV